MPGPQHSVAGQLLPTRLTLAAQTPASTRHGLPCASTRVPALGIPQGEPPTHAAWHSPTAW